MRGRSEAGTEPRPTGSCLSLRARHLDQSLYDGVVSLGEWHCEAKIGHHHKTLDVTIN
jgi:hypothetical protein